MKKEIIFMWAIALSALSLSGCGSFWRGAGAGVVGTGAAYEINTKMQLDRLEEDYRAGRISKEEYEIRRDQIRKGSLIY